MPSTHSISLIKLGGSIITDKQQPGLLREENLRRLVSEIGTFSHAHPEELVIVGHGSGSFAHIPAAQYQTMQGFTNDQSRYGMAVVQDMAAQLNRIVVGEFLRQNQPAVSLAPSNLLVTAKRQVSHFCFEVLMAYLEQGVLPITYGDVIVDTAQGCTIWSTEEVLALMATQLAEKKWSIKQIIHVTEVAGFYAQAGQVVPKITAATWPDLQRALTVTKGTDVTGGMGLKVEESLKLAQLGITSKIISGLAPGCLSSALAGQSTLGTEISL